LFLPWWDSAGLHSAWQHRRMGGCEIPLTDPSAARLASNKPAGDDYAGDRTVGGGLPLWSAPPARASVAQHLGAKVTRQHPRELGEPQLRL
jgi:hypothetical protein